MEIRSILVNVDLDTSNQTSLNYAIDLAGTFGAELIGIAADQPSLSFSGIDGGAAVDFYATERGEIETQLQRTGEAFRLAVPAGMKAQWRAFVSDPVTAIIESARLADLIVMSSKTMTSFRQPQSIDLGELVLASGRPVLDIANSVGHAKFDKIMIAWKDTREARRAVADALPFLAQASEVLAVTVSEGDYAAERSSLDDLLAWLKLHDVAAQADVINNPEGFVDVIESTALSQDVDLLVTGGYGHSRVREWLFGGVTRNLLEANSLNRLFSN